VWIGETVGFSLTRLDPDSGKFERFPIDPRGFIKGRGHDPIVDKDQNVWLATIVGKPTDQIRPQERKIINYEPPTPNSYPTGWTRIRPATSGFRNSVQCRIAKFDPKTEEWTEYPLLTAYQDDPFCTVRRPTVGPDGTVWYGIFNKGILGKARSGTGKMVEYKVPMATSSLMTCGRIRPATSGSAMAEMGGTLIRFDPRTETFASIRRFSAATCRRFEITREGAVWYNPRSAPKGAVGVLYPGHDPR